MMVWERRVAVLVLLWSGGAEAAYGQSSAAQGRQVHLYVAMHEARATAAGRLSLRIGNYPGAATGGIQVEATTAFLGLRVEANRWMVRRGHVICGECSHIIPTWSVEGVLAVQPWPGSRLAPYLAGGAGALRWNQRTDLMRSERLGADWRWTGRLGLRMEVNHRKLMTGPLYLGDHIGYFSGALGLRFRLR
jgi:hypothetical protein